MSCLKVNNIYIEQEYAYIPEAQECMQPLHSCVSIHKTIIIYARSTIEVDVLHSVLLKNKN